MELFIRYKKIDVSVGIDMSPNKEPIVFLGYQLLGNESTKIMSANIINCALWSNVWFWEK